MRIIHIEIDTGTIGSQVIDQIQDHIHDAMLETGCVDKYQQVIDSLKDETHCDDDAWSTFRAISEFLQTKEVE